ncbi:MAG: SagB/ThcOx family dehydrogenase [Candidatus Scalindua sp.]|nr:SagB/ThcOx family dehydrogenase [Candidatus Scalindua sp.]
MRKDTKSENKNWFQGVVEYHETTKHHPNRYARSSGYLDWETEPNPFRQYEGVKSLPLPLTNNDSEADYLALFKRESNKFREFSLQNIATFLELSMGLSAWKSYFGNSWVLRMNPSSGNLHPTETHLIIPPIPENDDYGGVFHYNPFLHSLEVRTMFYESFWQRIHNHFSQEGFLIGLTSIYWREAWKYGERAFRYCNHDVGHAMACLSFSANILGWKVTYLNSLSSGEIGTILGFPQTKWKEFEREEPELLLFVNKWEADGFVPRTIPYDIISSFEALQFQGEPNHLSKDHVDWEIIDDVSSMTLKPRTDEETYRYRDHDYFEKGLYMDRGAKIIRQRRSAQAYDGETAIRKEDFFAMLDKTIPRSFSAPFDIELGKISVHLLLFVHRIIGLETGLYFLIRNDNDYDDIRERCHAHFLWNKVKDAPQTLPLYFLQEGDYVREAKGVSCFQEIASDGAFSVGMIAKFRENIEKHPYLYRHLFWETGMIGQILYLEAEVHSVRGTGIGCFFDDLVHQILGLNDNAYQSLYHFTIGGALEDKRITTLPPYYHLKNRKELIG